MNIELIEINKLKPATYNPRQISTKQYNDLKKSIQKFDLVDPIIVNKDMTVIGGHQRLKICKELKYKDVDCVVLDLSKEEERELNIRLNKSGGEFDMDILANEFNIDELVDWGFKHIDLGLNIDKIVEGNTEDDYIPEVKESRVKLGDVWQLGKHRLMCGDSTKESDVEKLMNGDKAEISFTSPPYNTKENAKLSPHQQNGTKYNSFSDNLSDEDYLLFLQTFTKLSLEYSEYSFVNIQSLAGNKTALIDYLYLTKDIYAETIIWDKQSAQPAMAENVLNSQFEYIHIFSKKANRAIGTKHFRGTLSNLINISKQTKNKVKEHNATFSIDFALHFVNNFSNKIVLDLFLGSGTTLIACEKTNRTCYGMELDTKYCDVIIERWEQFTGQKAKKCGV